MTVPIQESERLKKGQASWLKHETTTLSARQVENLTQFSGTQKDFITWLKGKKILRKNNEPFKKYITNGHVMITLYNKNATPVVRFTYAGVLQILKLTLKELENELYGKH